MPTGIHLLVLSEESSQGALRLARSNVRRSRVIFEHEKWLGLDLILFNLIRCGTLFRGGGEVRHSNLPHGGNS